MRIAIGANRGTLRKGRENRARSVVINQEGHAKLATLPASIRMTPFQKHASTKYRPDVRAGKRENRRRILRIQTERKFCSLKCRTLRHACRSRRSQQVIKSRSEEEDDQLTIDGGPNGNTSTEGPSNERYNLKAFQLERE